jgi:hypothetical protein
LTAVGDYESITVTGRDAEVVHQKAAATNAKGRLHGVEIWWLGLIEERFLASLGITAFILR